jgi:ferredoxin
VKTPAGGEDRRSRLRGRTGGGMGRREVSFLQVRFAGEKCAGCLVCVLACSTRRGGVFTPTVSAVRVRSAGAGGVELEFGPECDGCGLCVAYCPYGALSMEKEGAAGGAG